MYTVTLLDGEVLTFEDDAGYMNFLHHLVTMQLEQLGVATNALKATGDIDPNFLKAMYACQTAMVGLSLMQTKKSISFVERDDMQGFMLKEEGGEDDIQE